MVDATGGADVAVFVGDTWTCRATVAVDDLRVIASGLSGACDWSTDRLAAVTSALLASIAPPEFALTTGPASGIPTFSITFASSAAFSGILDQVRAVQALAGLHLTADLSLGAGTGSTRCRHPGVALFARRGAGRTRFDQCCRIAGLAAPSLYGGGVGAVQRWAVLGGTPDAALIGTFALCAHVGVPLLSGHVHSAIISRTCIGRIWWTLAAAFSLGPFQWLVAGQGWAGLLVAADVAVVTGADLAWAAAPGLAVSHPLASLGGTSLRHLVAWTRATAFAFLHEGFWAV